MFSRIIERLILTGETSKSGRLKDVRIEEGVVLPGDILYDVIIPAFLGMRTSCRVSLNTSKTHLI